MATWLLNPDARVSTRVALAVRAARVVSEGRKHTVFVPSRRSGPGGLITAGPKAPHVFKSASPRLHRHPSSGVHVCQVMEMPMVQCEVLEVCWTAEL